MINLNVPYLSINIHRYTTRVCWAQFAARSTVPGLEGTGYLGVAMPPGLALGPLTRLEVWWQVQAPGTRLRSVTPLTDVAAAVARSGETATSGRHGGNLVEGCARTLIRSVPMGWPIIPRSKCPPIKPRPTKVKGLDQPGQRFQAWMGQV